MIIDKEKEGKINQIKDIIKKNFEIIQDSSSKDESDDESSEKKVSECFFFYDKESFLKDDSNKPLKRQNYCLNLDGNGFFSFQLRYGKSGNLFDEKQDRQKKKDDKIRKNAKDSLERLKKIGLYKWPDKFEYKNNKFEKNENGKNGSIEGVQLVIGKISCESEIKKIETFCQNFIDWHNHNFESFKNIVIKVKTQTAEEIIMEEQMKEITELLENNHNIILHGAPGTGKTYLAKEIAIDLIFENENDRKLIRKKEEEIQENEKEMYQALNAQLNEQCGFVQFHQSYDYTDFVEGLRPVNGDGNQIGFERKDGIFKKFCEKAIKSQIINEVDNFEEKYNELLEMVGEKGLVEIPALRGSPFAISLQDNGNGFVLWLKNDKGEYKKTEWGFFNFEQCYNIYRGMPGIQSKGQDNYRNAIVNYMRNNLKLENYVAGKTSSELKPFIFIIDEINRGEMSKIFGELFYSIDPGYRGVKGKIKTQYANLQEGPNEFDLALGINKNDVEKDGKKDGLNKGKYGHFFVPENVYIIGTMNDIDRSVESMDFAMRRRFAFKEIKAADSKVMFDNEEWRKNEGRKEISDEILGLIENRMDNLNAAILEEKYHLGQAYQIGGAYFLKFAKYYTGDGNEAEAFKKLWDNHIAGVIKEYLRGIDDKNETLFKELEKAYQNDSGKKATKSAKGDGVDGADAGTGASGEN